MSETNATPKANAARGWTDTDKIGILFQIIAKMEKPIPWAEIEVPEGRTLKAVQVMVDKEKTKVKKAREAAMGDENGDAPSTPLPVTPASKGKKRIAKTADTNGEESTAKKPKATRKNKVKAGEDKESTETAYPGSGNNAQDFVKAEADIDEL